MTVLVDTNVLLDVLLEREPFAAAATAIWERAEKRELKALACSLSFSTIYYVARKDKGREAARAAVRVTLSVFDVAGVDETVLRNADTSGIIDFEDAVQIASAVAAGCSHFVTRDLSGFEGAAIPVITPEQCLALLATQA